MGLCKKPPAFHLAACAAKCYFKQTSFSLILLRKINENDVCLKFYFAAVGGGILFTKLHTFRTAPKNFITPIQNSLQETFAQPQTYATASLRNLKLQYNETY